MKSDRTKALGRRKSLLSFLHFLCLFGTLLYFIPYGYITGETSEKVGMSFSIMVTVIILLVSIVVDTTHRAGLHKTMLWVMVIGCMITLDKVRGFVYILAVVSILDEILFMPILSNTKTQLISSKEIDKRG